MSVTFFGGNIIIVTKIKIFILNSEFFLNLKQHDNNYLKSSLTYIIYIYIYIYSFYIFLLLMWICYCSTCCTVHCTAHACITKNQITESKWAVSGQRWIKLRAVWDSDRVKLSATQTASSKAWALSRTARRHCKLIYENSI